MSENVINFNKDKNIPWRLEHKLVYKKTWESINLSWIDFQIHVETFRENNFTKTKIFLTSWAT